MMLPVDIPGPAGRLEALYEEPADLSPRFGALVCHPHPSYGGTMHNHATHRLAKGARALGGATLRFNFRGVGRSAGAFDEGRGEQGDVLAALAWLVNRLPDLPLYACGFSFGAWMVLSACGGAESPVRGLLTAGLAVRKLDHAVARGCARPVAAVQAENDELGPPEEVRAVLAELPVPWRLSVVPGATHLFTEDLTTFQHQVESGLSWLLESV
jgi:hypothetical protein